MLLCLFVKLSKSSPLPFAFADLRFCFQGISLISDSSDLACSDLQYIDIRPFPTGAVGTMLSADSHPQAFFARFSAPDGSPGVRHSSFTTQPPDLLLRYYVCLLGLGLSGNLTHRLALYPVSVRRLNGFATPLPSLGHCCLPLALRYAWR